MKMSCMDPATIHPDGDGATLKSFAGSASTMSASMSAELSNSRFADSRANCSLGGVGPSSGTSERRAISWSVAATLIVEGFAPAGASSQRASNEGASVHSEHADVITEQFDEKVTGPDRYPFDEHDALPQP